MAVREFDLIRSHFQIVDGIAVSPLSLEDRLTAVFCNYGFLPIRGEELRNKAIDILRSDSTAENSITKILGLRENWKSQSDGVLLTADQINKPLSAIDLPFDVLVELFDSVRSAGTPEESIKTIVQSLSEAFKGNYRLVFKAADQIPLIDNIESLFPTSNRLAIIRDGRDATVSALHYEKLPVARTPPLKAKDRKFGETLNAWKKRAATIVDEANRGRLSVVRYEDLSSNFEQCLCKLLDWLGLETSKDVVRQIRKETSFETMSGRKRGDAAVNVVRKGALGEWRQTLNRDEKQKAWDAAGAELTAFGYHETGDCTDDFAGKIG